MTKTKKNSKRDPLDRILIEGEEVLWQGKPHGSTLEYVGRKSMKLDYNEHDIGCFNIITPLAGALCSAGITGHLLNFLNFNGGIPILRSILVLLIFFVSFFLLFLIFTVLFAIIIRYIQKMITGVVEKPFIKYAITNQRIIVVTSSWVYNFLHHIAVRGVVIEDSKQGASVTWLAVSRDHTPIQPFLGLSEFDVNHILEIVRKRSTLAITIDDKREMKAQA